MSAQYYKWTPPGDEKFREKYTVKCSECGSIAVVYGYRVSGAFVSCQFCPHYLWWEFEDLIAGHKKLPEWLRHLRHIESKLSPGDKCQNNRPGVSFETVAIICQNNTN